MGNKNNKRKRERPTIHPKNRYSENPPDFSLLASLYSSFKPFVFYSRDNRPRIDWTDYNATRELTRVLLLHDHGLNWWIPDGQLCPTVPNRSNYIHWIEDLLSAVIIPKDGSRGDVVRGFDIGTGANCIYPLLGASLLGWCFVGSDITDVALEWAEKNVRSNGHISDLIEIRKVEICEEVASVGEYANGDPTDGERKLNVAKGMFDEVDIGSSSSSVQPVDEDQQYCGPPILLGVVKYGENFDFCMCNPPFFETMEEAGLNPKTSCGGTPEEMVCSGGEKAFVTRIIEDSVVLKDSFRWYTTMVGRKTNLKFLISKLREVGVSIVKTTEFVQGQTCRWGLAWSFLPPARKIISPHVAEKTTISFMLEGVQRQFSAIHVLQSIESLFCNSGASCKLNATSFAVDISASADQCDVIINNEPNLLDEATSCISVQERSDSLSSMQAPANNLHFQIVVFQQIPGTLLVKGSKQQTGNLNSASVDLARFDIRFAGVFSSIIQQLEKFLKQKFCRAKRI